MGTTENADRNRELWKELESMKRAELNAFAVDSGVPHIADYPRKDMVVDGLYFHLHT